MPARYTYNILARLLPPLPPSIAMLMVCAEQPVFETATFDGLCGALVHTPTRAAASTSGDAENIARRLELLHLLCDSCAKLSSGRWTMYETLVTLLADDIASVVRIAPLPHEQQQVLAQKLHDIFAILHAAPGTHTTLFRALFFRCSHAYCQRLPMPTAHCKQHCPC